jgi:hypothetical protein
MRSTGEAAIWVTVAVTLVTSPLALLAQGQGQGRQRRGGVGIAQAWDDVIGNVLPQSPTDPILTVPQTPVSRGGAGDFINHFFFQSSTEYIRQDVSFSGLPTPTGVIEAAPGAVFEPGGIPAVSPFQPSSDHVYHFMNWGTRGWLSPRVNTNFTARYRQDLTQVQRGAPQQTVNNTFGANRRIELLTGSVEINGLATDGAFAGSSVNLGRQYSYGAELAAFDGVSYRLSRPRYNLTLFGGRRFSYFSDPDQRAIGGGNIAFNLGRRSSFEYNSLFYIRGSHTFTFRSRLHPQWLFNTHFKLIGGNPIDYSAQVLYLPTSGKTTLRFSFFQKITNDDFFYDYTENYRERDSFNRLLRLYLNEISPWTQFVVDAHRELIPRVRVGGTFWVRRLNDSQDQGPFNTSFEDYRINSQVFPFRRLDVFMEYHQRNTDRMSPLGITQFDDVSRSGETRLQDLSGELRRTFGEGRLGLRGGVFWRRWNFQNRFFFIENARVFGVIAGGQVRLDSHTRLFVDYSLDDDFFVFRPSIQRAQVLRLGLNWKY